MGVGVQGFRAPQQLHTVFDIHLPPHRRGRTFAESGDTTPWKVTPIILHGVYPQTEASSAKRRVGRRTGRQPNQGVKSGRQVGSDVR